MNFTTIVAIVGAMGEAIGAVPIVLGWLRRKRVGKPEHEASEAPSNTESSEFHSTTICYVGIHASRITFDPDSGTMRLFRGDELLMLATFDHSSELAEAFSYFWENRPGADEGVADLFKKTLARVVPSSVTTTCSEQTTDAWPPTNRRGSELSTKSYHRLMTHLPPKERQFSEGFLEDGVEHLTSAGEPVRPFILKETRDTTFWILKLRLFKFARSRRRQIS